MTKNQRYLTQQIQNDLKRKMVFLGGPRQVGKTTLAKSILGRHADAYLNWDDAAQRSKILARELSKHKLWVFDEIHKYKSWRNYLKGLFDTQREQHQILVTGSARLDLYRRGGDSLQGRYHYLRLHPLSVAELNMQSHADFKQLLQLGGFPEPFFGGSAKEAKRWSREYHQRLIRDEVVSLEQVKDLGNLELLTMRLPHLVGSPLSINALREDLQVAHKTVANWLHILERLYGLIRLSPFGAPKIRAVKKEQKHYHYDWSMVQSEGARFENLVACHLLKWVQFQEDTEGRDLELRYFRDIDGREVDFVVTENGKPIFAVECKTSDEAVAQPLRYFKERFPSCAAWQIAANGKKDFVDALGIRVAPALGFLQGLV